MPNHDYHDSITVHHNTITILKSHNILMNFVVFYETGLPVKIPNITALSNINFATILNIFAKQKSFCFSYFVNLDKNKKSFRMVLQR